MTQITEDYCSFEIAKLLKEKGFDWQQSPFYSEQDMDGWKQENSYQIPNPDYDPNIPFDTETITMVAPHISQSLALKWLRKVHDLHIIVYPWQADNEEKAIHWCCKVYKSFAHLGNDVYTNETPKSYEQAVEAALDYVLKNLI